MFYLFLLPGLRRLAPSAQRKFQNLVHTGNRYDFQASGNLMGQLFHIGYIFLRDNDHLNARILRRQ